MSTYVRTETVEAMQWVEDVKYPDWNVANAAPVVAWVNANGGEARYETYDQTRIEGKLPAPSIAIRMSSGWAFVAPGDWIAMSDEWFRPDGGDLDQGFEGVREFTVVSAADWAAAGWQLADTAAKR